MADGENAPRPGTTPTTPRPTPTPTNPAPGTNTGGYTYQQVGSQNGQPLYQVVGPNGRPVGQQTTSMTSINNFLDELRTNANNNPQPGTVAATDEDLTNNTAGYTVEMPNAPRATQATASQIQARPGQLIDRQSGQLQGQTPNVTHTNVQADRAQTPEALKAALIDAVKTGKNIDEILAKFQYAQGTVSEESTVQGQLGQLMEQFKGGATPAWAAGALRAADDAMAARGLGASSMAGAATTQAAMEAALPIAMQDAQAHLTMQIKNLDNKQQVLLQKNESRINSFFTDAAAENAARQFNATSINQTRQFTANLRAQVDQFNTSQVNAMTQFNSGQRDAVRMFMAEMRDGRQRFNAENRLIVDQSNAEWRRQITTINNAEVNENNRLNAQLASNMTLAEYNSEMQIRRDAMSYAFTATQNAAQRSTEVMLAIMDIEEARAAREDESRSALWNAAGQFVSSVVDDVDWGDIF